MSRKLDARDVDLGPGGWETAEADLRVVGEEMRALASRYRLKLSPPVRYPSYRLTKSGWRSSWQVSAVLDFESLGNRQLSSLAAQERRYALGLAAWRSLGPLYQRSLGYRVISKYSAAELRDRDRIRRDLEALVDQQASPGD